MMHRLRSLRFGICGLLVLLVGLMTAGEMKSNQDLLAEADLAYVGRTCPEGMEEAIAHYEAVLDVIDSLPVSEQAGILNRLSQLYYESTTFTTDDAPEDQQRFERGREYGLQSLRLNPEFADAEGRDFKEAVSYVTDLAALHWTAGNWGKLLGMTSWVEILFQPGLVTQAGEILALFERVVAVDPGFWGGSACSSLGSQLVMSPGFLGGDRERGLVLMEKAIGLDSSYLSNRVILAEYAGFHYDMFGNRGNPADVQLIRQELTIVLEAEIGDWPFWNARAKERAAYLLEQL
jgi:tetratricopeptide (TPR) repeat protein